MNSFIPSGWELTTIGNVGKVVTGSTPSTQDPSYWGCEIPFVSPADFDGSVYVKSTQRSLTKLGANKGRLLPKDAVLVTCIGSLGGIVMSPNECVTNQQINAVIPSSENNPRYCFYNILFNIEDLTKNAGTTTIPIINKSTFEQINYLRPPLPEQQKIAAILTSVDDVIESTQAQINKLKDLKTGMMQELLTKGIGRGGLPHTGFKDSPVGRIPKAWEVLPLDRMATLIPGFAFSSADFVASGIPLIRMGNLYQNRLDLTRSPIFLPSDFSVKYKKFVAEPEDIVFSMTGTAGKEDYGFAVKIPKNAPISLINQRVAKVVPSHSVSACFLHNLLHSRIFLNEIYSVGKGTKQANLSSANILSVELPFPPMEEQIMISSALDAVEVNIDVATSKLMQLESIKKALMQDLLTGKVRVKVA